MQSVILNLQEVFRIVINPVVYYIFRLFKRNETEMGRIGHWNCHDCTAAFKVTCGTIFHGTKVVLQKWFFAISLMLNAKKSLSSHQLARDLDLNQKNAWRIMTCIRAEMAKKNVWIINLLPTLISKKQ